ncbi:MAG: hypothetical protein JST62_13970 [Bacteroidetes bacterium]|nr:hypothetical protein [Bacteroidota bacterium]
MIYAYIAIAVIFISVTVFLLNSKMFASFREGDKKRTFDFLVSLISTFIGFFIALSLNTLSGTVTQKKNLVKLLDTSNLSIENTEMKINGMYMATAKAGQDITPVIMSSPVELPRLYESIETNSLANDYLSAAAFQAYVLCSDNMRFFVKSANGVTTTNEQKVQVLTKYLKYLDLAKKVNNLEIQRLKGSLSESDEDSQLQKLINEITANQK